MASNEGGGRGSYTYTYKGGKQQARGQESPPSAARPVYTYNPRTRQAAPTPYRPPRPPRGHYGKGPSGKNVYHTEGAWKTINVKAHQRRVQVKKPSPIINEARLALLRALTSKGAFKAGAAIGGGLKLGKQVFEQEGQALTNEQAAKKVAKQALTGGGVVTKAQSGSSQSPDSQGYKNPAGLGGGTKKAGLPVGYVPAKKEALQSSPSSVIPGVDAAAKELHKLGKAVVEKGVTAPVVPGVGPKHLGGIHVPGAAAATVSPQRVKGTIGGNLVQNAFDFPQQSVQSTYQLITHPGKTIQGYAKTGFLPALASGDLKEAAKRFNKNPLYSALEARGAVSAAGRGVGAGLRHVPGAKMEPGEVSATRAKGIGTPTVSPGKPNLAGKLRLAGSQRRNPLKLTEGQHVRRRYSADVTVKAAQVAADRFRARHGADPNQAGRAAGPSGRDLGTELRKRATAQTELAEVSRRGVRAKEQHAATRPIQPSRRARTKAKVSEVLPLVRSRPVEPGVVPPKFAEGVVHAVAEGRIRGPATFVEDLRAEVARMRAAQPSLKGRSVTQNKKNIRALDKALKAPDLEQHIPALLAAGKETARVTRAHGEELVKAGVLDSEQARRARLMPYAVTHMAAEHNPVAGRLEVPVKPGGPTRELTNNEIEQHMTANGVNPKAVGFVSHNAAKLGSGAFYQANKLRRPTSGPKRTGEATQKGTMPTSQEALVAQRVGGAGKVEQARQMDRMVREMAVKPERGIWRTKKDAADEAQRRSYLNGERIPGTPEYVAVNMRPRDISPEQAQTIKRLQTSKARFSPADKLTNELAARMTEDTGPGEYRLIAKDQLDTITKQAEGRNTAEKAVGAVTQQFRGAVLPFSPKWLTGNQVELYGVRLPAYGIGPRTIYFGHTWLKGMEQENAALAEQVTALTHQGRIFGSTPRLMTHTNATQFEGTGFALPARALHAIRVFPGSKQVIDTLQRYQRVVFNFNSKLEGGGELGALAKMAKETYADLGDFGHSWLKTARMGQQLAKEVTSELERDPNLKFEFGRRVDEMLGKYNGFSPEMRHIIQTYAPFLPWYLNSVRFIYWTLPIHHPVKTAVLVAAEQAMQKDFQDSKLPDNLRGAIQRKDKGLIDFAHFTPAGAFTDPSSWADVILPQLGSTQKALSGQDFTGRDIKVPDGSGGERSLTGVEKRQLAAYVQAEGLIPGLRIFRQVLEGGKTPTPTSTIFNPQTKPNTGVGTLNRMLNPLRPVYLKSPKSKKKTKAVLGGSPDGPSSAPDSGSPDGSGGSPDGS